MRDCLPRRFVSNIIEKGQDPNTSATQKATLLAALKAALRPCMAPDVSLMAEWVTAVVWMDMRTVCAHPLRDRLEMEGGAAELRRLASSQSAEYASVCLLGPTLLNVNKQPPPA